MALRSKFRFDRYAIGGYAARFDLTSPIGGRLEQVRHGAFAKAIAAGRIHLLVNHLNYADHRALSLASMSRGTLHVEEDSVGLWFEASLYDDAHGARMMQSVQQGMVTGASTGCRGNFDYVCRGKNGVDLLTESNPWEISLVTAPRQPGRRGTWVKPLEEALRLKKGQ